MKEDWVLNVQVAPTLAFSLGCLCFFFFFFLFFFFFKLKKHSYFYSHYEIQPAGFHTSLPTHLGKDSHSTAVQHIPHKELGCLIQEVGMKTLRHVFLTVVLEFLIILIQLFLIQLPVSGLERCTCPSFMPNRLNEKHTYKRNSTSIQVSKGCDGSEITPISWESCLSFPSRAAALINKVLRQVLCQRISPGIQDLCPAEAQCLTHLTPLFFFFPAILPAVRILKTVDVF